MISVTGQEGGGHKSLRAALGQFATGVAVVTVTAPDGPAGMTINSHCSLSLDPPLLLWCLRRDSARFARFAGAEHFAVNVLASGQELLARQFASAASQPSLRWRAGPLGVPLLPGTLGSFTCRRDGQAPGGDHLIIIGRLEHYEVTGGQTPLTFFGGRYHAGPPDQILRRPSRALASAATTGGRESA